MAGKFKREGTYVYLMPVHVDVQQKSSHYCNYSHYIYIYIYIYKYIYIKKKLKKDKEKQAYFYGNYI